MKIFYTPAIVVLLLSLAACLPQQQYTYQQGYIDSTRSINMGDVNSIYDDINSDLRGVLGGRFDFYFSTNRRNGKEFDIFATSLELSFSQTSGKLALYMVSDQPYMAGKLLNLVNNDSSQYGPHSFNTGVQTARYVFMYADSRPGNLDIYYVHPRHIDWGTYQASQTLEGPFALNFLNTEANEAYPCVTQDKLYYCSDETGYYQLYEVQITNTDDITVWLAQTTSVVSSRLWDSPAAWNDKSPLVIGNSMFFVSDRPGGYGGNDIWRSEYSQGRWQEPVNMGESVNTEYDELRPVIYPFYNFQNMLMIFSSNRPGGKGGYDLYYTGVGMATLEPF